MFFILAAVSLCCFVFHLEIRWLAFANAVAVSLGTLVTHIEVQKLIQYSLLDRLKDTYKSIISTLIMCGVLVPLIRLLGAQLLPTIIKLVIEVVVGAAVYILASILLKNRVLFDMLAMIKSKKGAQHG